jgi:hypothetical protein
MKFCFRGTIIACSIAIASVSPARADTLWIYGGGQDLYSTVQISDTQNIQPPFTDEIEDTSYSFDTTIGYYFTFNYRFPGYSVPESTALAVYANSGGIDDSGLSSGKGWAAFKLTWEHRVNFAGWDVRGYNTLLIKYKSSLPYHKADIFFGQCDNPYDPAFVDSIGTIAADSTWTTTAIPIPPPRKTFDSTEYLSDSAERQYLEEIRFIIHNVPSHITDSTSPPGNFCLDEVGVTNVASSIRPQFMQPAIHPAIRQFADRIVLTVPAGAYKISIVDLSGREVFMKESRESGRVATFSIATTKFARGMYLLNVAGQGQHIQQKFILGQ